LEELEKQLQKAKEKYEKSKEITNKIISDAKNSHAPIKREYDRLRTLKTELIKEEKRVEKIKEDEEKENIIKSLILNSKGIDIELFNKYLSERGFVCNENINDAIKKLNNKEIAVMVTRWEKDKYKSFQEVGKIMNLTRERIRQIESSSIKKLKDYKSLGIVELKKEN